MTNQTAVIGSIAVIIFTITPGKVTAQTPQEAHIPNAVNSNQFQRINQPLENKLAVTLAGLGLISLELWWFLFSKPKARKVVATDENMQR